MANVLFATIFTFKMIFFHRKSVVPSSNNNFSNILL